MWHCKKGFFGASFCKSNQTKDRNSFMAESSIYARHKKTGLHPCTPEKVIKKYLRKKQQKQLVGKESFNLVLPGINLQQHLAYSKTYAKVTII
jgi:hypothetical protein